MIKGLPSIQLLFQSRIQSFVEFEKKEQSVGVETQLNKN